MDSESNIKNILLVEDDPGDVELTLAALEENHLAKRIVGLARTEKMRWIIFIVGGNLKGT